MFKTKHIAYAACLSILMNGASLFCTNVVVVSGQEVLTQSKRGQEINQDLENLRTSLMAPVQKLQTDLEKAEQAFSALQKKGQALASDLESNAKMLSKEAQQKKIDELKQLEEQAKDMATDLNRLAEKRNNAVKQAEEKLKQKYQELMQKFNAEIDDVIKGTATKESWDVVLMKEQCVYVNTSIDHTKRIIALLDAEWQKNKVEKSAAQEKKVSEIKTKK